MAEAGRADAVSENPAKRRPGLMNLFTYGRTVTLTIQTMRSIDPEFDVWWKPYQDKMASDKLMRYFNTTRTEIIHEGILNTSTSMVIGGSGPVNMGALFHELTKHAPPNTVRVFLGEGSTGGNGWEVRMPDGSTTKLYFSLPDSFDIKSELRLPEPPTHHDGKLITDTSAANLATLYIDSLRQIVRDFETRYA